jgi:hypothetical protein
MGNHIYCKKCTLKEDHPGVTIDETGICNFCKLEVPEEIFTRYRYVHDSYQKYINSIPRTDGGYDCLLMLSGGKDSIYMLDKILSEGKRKVLAFTYNLPYESIAGLRNIEKMGQILDVDHILFTNHVRYRRLMKHVFNNIVMEKPGDYLDEKLPCIMCSQYFLLSGCLLAYQMKIPFVLYCSDPQQLYTFESNLQIIIKTFMKKVGEDMTNKTFGTQLAEFLDKDDKELPQIVFPYVPLKGSYYPQQIMAELIEKGLYEGKRLVTHCSLFGLLNYYAYKHWNNFYYLQDIAARFRDGDLKGDSVKQALVKGFDELKHITLGIASGQLEPEEQKQKIKEIFLNFSYEEEAEYFANLIINFKTIGEELEVDIS